MTFNIWNYTPHWGERRRLTADLIVDHQPDVVCLQETRHDFRFERGSGQDEQLALDTGYHATFHVAQVYVPVARVDEGLTILSRRPPLASFLCRLTQHPHLRHDENRRICLGITVEHEGVEVDVYTTHFSLDAEAEVTNAEETARFVVESAGSRPAILTGDLNAEPGSRPIHRLTHDQNRFIDCWTAIHPEDPGYTYPSYRPVRRIDYVLAQGAAGVAGIELLGGVADGGLYPSDHLGILAEIALPGTSLYRTGTDPLS